MDGARPGFACGSQSWQELVHEVRAHCPSGRRSGGPRGAGGLPPAMHSASLDRREPTPPRPQRWRGNHATVDVLLRRPHGSIRHCRQGFLHRGFDAPRRRAVRNSAVFVTRQVCCCDSFTRPANAAPHLPRSVLADPCTPSVVLFASSTVGVVWCRCAGNDGLGCRLCVRTYTPVPCLLPTRLPANRMYIAKTLDRIGVDYIGAFSLGGSALALARPGSWRWRRAGSFGRGRLAAKRYHGPCVILALASCTATSRTELFFCRPLCCATQPSPYAAGLTLNLSRALRVSSRNGQPGCKRAGEE